jgi:pyrimidine-nucleoside phosphorylase
MKTVEEARELGRAMIELGRHAGRETICVLTDMDQPLGCAVGNALEVREAAETVQGSGPADFSELVLDSVAHLLALSDLGVDEEEGRGRAEDAVASGAAFEAYERWIRAQHGDPDLARLPVAPVVLAVPAPHDGAVASLGAIRIGLAALHLGAGRRTKEDDVDHAVGVVCLRKRGDAVCRGEPLAEVHASDTKAAEEAAVEVVAAYELTDAAPPAGPIVLEVLT